MQSQLTQALYDCTQAGLLASVLPIQQHAPSLSNLTDTYVPSFPPLVPLSSISSLPLGTTIFSLLSSLSIPTPLSIQTPPAYHPSFQFTLTAPFASETHIYQQLPLQPTPILAATYLPFIPHIPPGTPLTDGWEQVIKGWENANPS
uniref:Uncharacterized protein n=1 Tax=Moniliophthora roreri TaxID=221103 RepID=A0A0W0FAW6_MONRR